MQHYAELNLTIENEKEDNTAIIMKAFAGKRPDTLGSFNGSVNNNGKGQYFITYTDFPYYEGNDVENYCILLAGALPYTFFTLTGVINNEGAGGDYVDHVGCRYAFGKLEYEYYNGYEQKTARFYLPTRRSNLIPEFIANVAKEKGEQFADQFTVENGILKKYVGPGGTVAVPDGVTEIGEGAFYGTAPVRVVLPESVVKIGHQAFRRCISLIEINLPNGLNSIGVDAFEGCTSLENVSFPSSLKKIFGGAFEGCLGLTEIILPEGIELGSGSFKGCSGIEELVLPEGIIGASGAFTDCSELTAVTLPDTMDYAPSFRGCEKLRNVVLPQSAMERIAGYDDYIMKGFLNRSNWQILVPAQQAEIFMKHYNKALSESFKACVPQDQIDSMGEAILERLNQEASIKDCNATAGYFTLFGSSASKALLQKLYQVLKTKKGSKRAVTTIESDLALMQAIQG